MDRRLRTTALEESISERRGDWSFGNPCPVPSQAVTIPSFSLTSSIDFGIKFATFWLSRGRAEVPLKTLRGEGKSPSVGEAWKLGEGVPLQGLSTDQGSKLRGPSSIALVLLYCAMLINTQPQSHRITIAQPLPSGALLIP
ncbi:hypothetical protein TNCV_4424221 [Trichonephila clavipes]|nr:hypothetical protein TNCV_4424221 [Trichonephila clavipes]